MMNSRLTELHAAIQPGESATATHWPVSSEARRSAGFRSAYVSSKTGKAQNEHMFSGVPPITDMRRWPCRYQTFYLQAPDSGTLAHKHQSAFIACQRRRPR
jgi:hypothetical protein